MKSRARTQYWFGLPIWCHYDESHILKYLVRRYGEQYKITQWSIEECPYLTISSPTVKTADSKS